MRLKQLNILRLTFFWGICLVILAVADASAVPGTPVSPDNRAANAASAKYSDPGQLADAVNLYYDDVIASGKDFCFQCCTGQAGNADNSPDGIRDLADVLYLALAIFVDGPALVCPAAGNADGSPDCFLDLGDVLTLAIELFLGGPPSADCDPNCE